MIYNINIYDLINFYREIKDGSTKLEEAQKNKKNLD